MNVNLEYDTIDQQGEEDDDEFPTKHLIITLENNIKTDGNYFTTPLFPDECTRTSKLYDQFFSSPPSPYFLKLSKFFFFAFTLIFFFHWYVRFMDFENDEDYFLLDFWKYDSMSVILDLSAWFFIGRLSSKRGIDTIETISITFLSAWFMSKLSDFDWARYSLSMYYINCRWPLTLKIVAVGVLLILTLLVSLHAHHAASKNFLFAKLLEMSFLMSLFLGPVIANDQLHLHHWFIAFLLGPHASFDVWWSRATHAFLLGMYLNGIAVYGRDPILGCNYGYYVSENQQCSYFECYYQYDDDTNSTNPIPYVVSDWRNCSSPPPRVPHTS